MALRVNKIAWTIEAWNDYLEWQTKNKKILAKINQIIQDIMRNGNEGIGQSEYLKYELSGLWSRRIDKEHRITYRIEERDSSVIIFSCATHYEK